MSTQDKHSSVPAGSCFSSPRANRRKSPINNINNRRKESGLKIDAGSRRGAGVRAGGGASFLQRSRFTGGATPKHLPHRTPESCRRAFICALTGWMKQEVKKRVQPLTSCFLQRVPNVPQIMDDEGPASLFSTCCLSLMGYLRRGPALTAFT